MRTRTATLTIALLWLTALPASAQYGSIAGLKVSKPDDKVDIKSVPPPDGAVVLFDGKSFDGWVRRRDPKSPPTWKLLPGGIMEVKGGGDIITKKTFAGSFRLHVEFRVPYMPHAKGQDKGNSGVYLQGRYEIQVLDSYGAVKPDNRDCGAIYEISAPKVNACKAPTVWQSYDVEFTSPKCQGGKKVQSARMTVYHNGIKVQDNVEIPVKCTRSGMNTDPCTPGPILLQDHRDAVQFRNVWLLPGK